MRVAIGSDHAGFELKERVKAWLADLHHDTLDLGTHSTDPVDYPDYAQAVGRIVGGGQADRGIVICGSGVGASVAANKVLGVRAGVCHDTYSAHQGVEHDDINVLVLGGRVIGAELARDIVTSFLSARFTGEERHRRRLAKVIAMENPLSALEAYGQSVWLDYIRRNLITSGELQRLITEDGLRGVTSNPSIFEKAITGSTDYKAELEASDAKSLDAKAFYERLAIRDIQAAADLLRPVYDRTRKRDGYVSLEVSPLLAHDEKGTVEEARRLWKTVARANVMIKVPATAEGIPAIEQLIGEGINVNVTLLFAQDTYEHVAEAYQRGVDRLALQGSMPLGQVASVASFFISRIDTAIDGLLTARLKSAGDEHEQALLRSLYGKVAIANAKLTYRRYQELFSGPRWQGLADRGAQTQRLLWASTSTKNPSYRDVIYVEELIGADTVNTMPPATLDAFRDHGRPRASLVEDVEGAVDTMATLEKVGVSMKEVTDRLLVEAVELFSESFDKLLLAITRKDKGIEPGKRRQSYVLPERLGKAFNAALEDWRVNSKVRRLWARDASLWTGADEANWLGWLGITNGQLAHLERFKTITDVVKREGLSHALLLGMGGSSLGPEVLTATFGRIAGFPELHVLDSTDPAQVRTFEQKVNLRKTVVIVSSKSGGTLEPNIFKQYFFERMKQVLGEKAAGQRFVAITDPGSKMQLVAESDRFRRVFHGVPSIGGRYSVLSDFGLVPAAIMGLDVGKLLDRAEEMVNACMPSVPLEENPGAVLGLILGAAHNEGQNKLTIVASPGLTDFGAWLEQLIAESTGKAGKGIIPVDKEILASPDLYGQDRLFVYVRNTAAPDPRQDRAIEAIERADLPVIRIPVDDPYDLGREFFRWEFATAVAGAVIGIHPFDQPDVEASKVATRKLTTEYEHSGTLPAEVPIFEEQDIKLFADEHNAAALRGQSGARPTLAACLRNHLNRLRAGDYFAVLAYVEMNEAHEQVLQAIRHAVRDRKRVATCLGFGPRFLHSTGQAYKGGPNTGVFLQLTCDDAVEVPVPGQRFTFGVVKAAQARGDFQVLVERHRRALRVHLGTDASAGLKKLAIAVDQALQ